MFHGSPASSGRLPSRPLLGLVLLMLVVQLTSSCGSGGSPAGEARPVPGPLQSLLDEHAAAASLAYTEAAVQRALIMAPEAVDPAQLSAIETAKASLESLPRAIYIEATQSLPEDHPAWERVVDVAAAHIESAEPPEVYQALLARREAIRSRAQARQLLDRIEEFESMEEQYRQDDYGSYLGELYLSYAGMLDPSTQADEIMERFSMAAAIDPRPDYADVSVDRGFALLASKGMVEELATAVEDRRRAADRAVEQAEGLRLLAELRRAETVELELGSIGIRYRDLGGAVAPSTERGADLDARIDAAAARYLGRWTGTLELRGVTLALTLEVLPEAHEIMSGKQIEVEFEGQVEPGPLRGDYDVAFGSMGLPSCSLIPLHEQEPGSRLPPKFRCLMTETGRSSLTFSVQDARGNGTLVLERVD